MMVHSIFEDDALPTILALTLNPCVDVSYNIDHLIEDQKAHATATRYDPGGNGINVARALKRLHISAHSLCVIAGEIGRFLERLIVHQLENAHCIHIEGETRINATIVQQSPSAQFEVSGIGPPISALTLRNLTDTMLRLAGDGIVVLTGSLPPGVPLDYYADVAHQLRQQGGRPVIDAPGPILKAALPARPFLVKPNRYELEQLLGRSLPTREDVCQAAQQLQADGVDYVCVSLGADGAVLADAHQVYYATAPKVTVDSTVGAGDSMLGGLIAALSRSEPPSEALRLALACGSGTAAQPGTELFDYHQLQTLLSSTDLKVVTHCINPEAEN